MSRQTIVNCLLVMLCLAGASTAFGQKKGVYTDPNNADADFAIQGEYTGTLETDDEKVKFGAQVIALGDNKFQGVGYLGGLPGDGWDGDEPERVEASASGGKVTFRGQRGVGHVGGGVAQIVDLDGNALGKLQRVIRESPTLGAKPPAGAVVLFDGSSVDGWQHRGKPARMTDDGLLMQGAASKERFQSHRLHIEFRLPYQPTARGQGRGNSGVYLQGRYEVQMLDSFGLTGEHNECGGIYTVSKPRVNMCYPPLSWQTFDVEFKAAKFDDSGEKTKNARISVRHNGVLVHDNIEIPHSTTASPLKEGPEAGYVYVQDHGNPVRYRNIWAVRLNDNP